ncbi:MAG: hypothetical protein K9J16_08740 [Melioribacteraceae bacterium]|nr:hypothetical protein [Melioribacteraceae bacterium]MCF8353994.1 hypothetical protein [Melioribacteraceae bacterium]MCF8393722.1 hypothetical protein [Melioribacteraceae bacterium]MCF8419536.1 hypothetical protein [Melioribacteraceae bacterium]
MSEDKNIHTIPTPLFGLLGSIGHLKYGWYHHFEVGTLFWSLTRLFSCYHRIVTVVNLGRDHRPFIEEDIENYIIRMRIVLNDVAFIIRQLLPENKRDLKNPKGGTHPKNREMSIFEIIDFFSKYPDEIPQLSSVLNNNKGWISRMKNQRDNIIHYKSKVIIFETEPDISFAMLNAAGTEKTEKTSDGGIRVVMTPVFEFINSQTVSLYNFLQIDLYNALKEFICKTDSNFKEIGTDPRMSCIGIEIFKKINNIGT